MARLAWNAYGKAAVHLSKVERIGERHAFHELTVAIRLVGDFSEAHTAGINANILPTDTMKNTVYALAREGPVDPPEVFAERLGRRFLAASPYTRSAIVTVTTTGWERAAVGGLPHEHAFVRGPSERRLATVTVRPGVELVEAGLTGLGLLKTTGSAFSGYLVDEYTTLPETRERVLATEVEATWRYTTTPSDWSAAWHAVRAALIETFATHESESVQQTLYAMGEAALAACADAAEIRLVLPNQHHLLVDLSAFGLDNPNMVFVSTREPFGRIEAVIER